MSTVIDQQNESLFGIHLLVDAYDCNEKKLSDPDALLKLLFEIPKEMGMHRLCEPLVVKVEANDKKDPGGYSGFVMIAESHISFHTFPKRGFVTADVYTCQTDTDTDKIIQRFLTFFETDNVETKVIPRGTRYPNDNICDS